MGYNLAVECPPHGIRVNTVAPWYIDTPLAAPVLANPAALQVSSLVAFLCLDAAAFVSGQCIAADGAFLRNGFF
ncbi:hypothetical protein B484DRAFT_419814 [Ochromonadaceae sp. CCMP2298]|nr:hypothetical protein B484DRAFT_419814 [Ochromonadaceae sp. CCMP2298]